MRLAGCIKHYLKRYGWVLVVLVGFLIWAAVQYSQYSRVQINPCTTVDESILVTRFPALAKVRHQQFGQEQTLDMLHQGDEILLGDEYIDAETALNRAAAQLEEFENLRKRHRQIFMAECQRQFEQSR